MDTDTLFVILMGAALACLLVALVISARNLIRALKLNKRFLRIWEDWKRDTRLWSDTDSMMKSPYYAELIQMGRPIVPYILREMRADKESHGGFLHLVLEGIFNDAPEIPEESLGRIRIINDTFIEWAEKKVA